MRLNSAAAKNYWVNELLAASPLWTNDDESQAFLRQCQLANGEWTNTDSWGDFVTVLLRANDVDEVDIDVLLRRSESMRLVVYGKRADRLAAAILKKIGRSGKDQTTASISIQRQQQFRLNLLAIETLNDLPFQHVPKLLTTDLTVSQALPVQAIAEPSRNTCFTLTLDHGQWKVPPNFDVDVVEGVLITPSVCSVTSFAQVKFWQEGGHWIFDCRSVTDCELVADVLESLHSHWPKAVFNIQEETVSEASQAHRAYLSGQVAGNVCRGCTIERDTHNDLVQQISGALSERASLLAKVFLVSVSTRCSGTTTAILSALFSCQRSFEFALYYNVSGNGYSRTFNCDASPTVWMVFHVVDAAAWAVMMQPPTTVLQRQRTVVILDFFTEGTPIPNRADRLIVPTAILSEREVNALCSVYTAHCPGREGTFDELRTWMLRDGADPFDKHLIQFPLTFARGKFTPLADIAFEVSTAIENGGKWDTDFQFLVFEAFCFQPQALVYRANVVPSRALLSSRIAVRCGAVYRALHPFIAFVVVAKYAAVQVVAAVRALLDRASTTSRAWDTARALLLDRPKRVAFSHLVGWLYSVLRVEGAVAFVKSVIEDSHSWKARGQAGHHRLLVARLYLRDITETWFDIDSATLDAFLDQRVRPGVEQCTNIPDELTVIRERTKGFLYTYAVMALLRCGSVHSGTYENKVREAFQFASEVDRSASKAAVRCQAMIAAVRDNCSSLRLIRHHFPQQSLRLDDDDE